MVLMQQALLTFRLGTQDYALPIEVVAEVAAMVAVTTLPDAPPTLMGIVNRHGELIPLIDLRRVVGLPPHTITSQSLFIVVEQRGQCAGLVVDEVYQVKYWQPQQAHLSRGTGHLIETIISEGAQVLQIMALESVLAMALPNQFAKPQRGG